MLRNIWRTDVLKIISLLCWCLALFCYFFQFPLRRLASFIVPSIFLYVIFNYRNLKLWNDKLYLLLLTLWYVFLGLECFNSVFRGNDINHIFRFLELLSFLPICLFIKKDKFDSEYRVLVFFAVLKSLLLIGIAIYLIKLGDHRIIRNYVLGMQGGDVYLAGSYRPKVQLQGNGIIPFVFMLYNTRKIHLNFNSICLFLGILVAGNFAFLLCLGLFFIYKIYKLICSKRNRLGTVTPIVLLFFLFSLPFAFKYINETRKQKAGYSNAIRIEQAQFLLNTNYFIGNGLGNNVQEQGRFRTYENDIYFELQTFYIFNQIGISGLFIFYILILFGIWKKNRTLFSVFIIYLFYSFWNPYCFDTTEMIVIISILNLFKKEIKLVRITGLA